MFYRKQCTYNLLMRKGKLKMKNTGGASSNYNYCISLSHYSDEYYPTTLLEVPIFRFKDGYTTQKPVPLYKYLIKTYINKNDTMLDNCMVGSGTVGVVRINTNRNYIGIELNEEYYYRIAEERMVILSRDMNL